jgi:hypothetical protein
MNWSRPLRQCIIHWQQIRHLILRNISDINRDFSRNSCIDIKWGTSMISILILSLAIALMPMNAMAMCAPQNIILAGGSPSNPIKATRTINVKPGDNYCAAINAAMPGDEIVFAKGSYTSPCSFNINGTAAKPIYIRSANPVLSERARFSCSGCSGLYNFFEISGGYIVFRDFYFLNNDADIMFRLNQVKNISIENNVIENIPGAQVLTANSGNTDGLVFKDNTVKNVTYTAIYLGCQSGSCYSTNFLIENNFIDASQINDTSITGYAMEVKLNSYGTIRDNSFFNAQGPPLMVYGNQDATTPPNIIEGNYFEKSRTDAALNVGGGPAIVRNNVIINQGGTALYAQNYGSRNLQRNISILNNTIVSSGSVGIKVEAWSTGANNIIAGNAIYSPTPYYPATITATIQNNVICASTSGCFKGSATASPYNFTPKIGGPLDKNIGPIANSKYDFFGLYRGTNNQPGAILFDTSTENFNFNIFQVRPARLKRCFN